MKVYNENKTEILNEYDLKLGYLKNDTITIHIDKVEEKNEEGHYEITQEYSNGGIDIKWIVDVERIDAVEEQDIEEKIQVYIPYTDIELLKINADRRIQELKEFLSQTDYIVIKLYEKTLLGGSIISMIQEYTSVLKEREAARKEINELEIIN